MDLRSIARQNVLLITIDTLRADALGCYGGPASTPALDRLASEGVRFTFAHAQAVLTLPSHTSILTGLYPFQHGIRENSGYRVGPATETIATMLKRDGYGTSAFVAAFPLHSRFGLNMGFDVYDDHFGETRAPTEFVMPERPATAVVPLARKWIAEAGGHPWLVWVHVFDPHAPYQPPPPFDREYAAQPYYGEVAATDHALAPLLEDIRESSRPTLVVATADHGEALGDHGEATHGLFAYESTLRVPLIIAELGGGSRRDHPTGGEVSTTPARHVDLVPTILDAVGRTVPRDLPGRTLLPASERTGGAAPRPSYFEAMSAMLNRGWAPLTGLVVDRAKYVDLPIPELYDIGTDPAETVNLAGRQPERQRSMVAALRAFGGGLPGRRQTEDSEATARLRALGYVAEDAPIKERYTEADDPKRLIEVDQAIHRGVALYGDKRYAEAEQLYTSILQQRPDMALAYRHLAFILWETGELKNAIGVLQRAVANGVRHGGVVTQLGTYLAETGEPAGAVALLEPLTQTNADPDALNALGIAYARAHRTEEARRVFERELASTPMSGMALENLGALDLERRDFASARQHFERALLVDPRSSQANAGLGAVAAQTGDRKTAIERWKAAVALDPTNFDALYNLGTTLIEDGQRAAAQQYLEQFVRSAPPALYARDIHEVATLLKRQ